MLKKRKVAPINPINSPKTDKMKPFIKICGGKTSLLPVLSAYLPAIKNKKDIKYVEPFLGGGSVLLYMVDQGLVKASNCYVNELNEDTYTAWNIILSSAEVPSGFSSCLTRFDHAMSSFDLLIKTLEYCKKHNSKKFFYETRASYKNNSAYVAERVGQFIYLNKTCFNGLIRYNQSGEFNTPYGDYKNPGIYDLDNLKNIHQKLGSLGSKDLFEPNPKKQIFNLDFEEFFKKLLENKVVDSNTFVYLDPPYLPISVTSNFTSYTKNGFNEYDHYRLKAVMDYLTKLGAKVMLSNSNSPLTREIFKDYNIIEVDNIRNVGAKAKSRGKIKELLILNYFDK